MRVIDWDSRTDNSALFIFDWNKMDGYYRQIAFTAIADALRTSRGMCAFHDGDLLESSILTQLAQQEACVVPAQVPENSPTSLKDLAQSDPTATSYAAAMWSDYNQNFRMLHDALDQGGVTGYLGCLLLGELDRGTFLVGFAMSQLSLPKGIVFIDGEIIPKTSKYGVGQEMSQANIDLLAAAQDGDIDADAVNNALDRGADVTCERPHERGEGPLMEAVMGDKANVVRRLLQAGANPNVGNLSNTVLMLAARYGYIEVVEELLTGGADVNLPGRGGGTALDWVIDETDDVSRRIVDILLRAGGLTGELEGPTSATEARDRMGLSISSLVADASASISAYIQSHERAHIDKAIDLATQALKRTELHAPERSARESLLGRAYFERYRLDRMVEDLQFSISLHIQAVTGMDTSDVDVPLYFTSLGNALLDRYALRQLAINNPPILLVFLLVFGVATSVT